MSDLTPKPVSASQVEMTQIVMPGDANLMGTAFGGRVVGWIDLSAAMVAQRHGRMPAVTVSIDQLNFLAPVRIGHMAVLRAHLNAVFGSSMEIEVVVETENPLTGEQCVCCKAFVTFVSLGPDGRPTRAPPLRVETEEQVERQRQAGVRRAARLAARGR